MMQRLWRGFDNKVCAVLIMHVHKPLHVPRNWALISAFVVDEDCRGEGIGAALLNAAEQHAFALGCGQIELSSNERRIRSHAFYEHNGYEEKRKRFVKYAGQQASIAEVLRIRL